MLTAFSGFVQGWFVLEMGCILRSFFCVCSLVYISLFITCTCEEWFAEKQNSVFLEMRFWFNESLLFEETNKPSWLADHWTEHCASGFILYFKDFLTVGQRISPSGIFQRKSIRMKIHCGRCVAALNVGWFPSIHCFVQ